MALTKKQAPDNLPVNPAEGSSYAEAAAKLPEKDAVQKAYKDAMTTQDGQTEAKAKVKVVDESPNAAETPSGGALKKVAGIANDHDRGEAYAREKQARRWNTQPVDDGE